MLLSLAYGNSACFLCSVESKDIAKQGWSSLMARKSSSTPCTCLAVPAYSCLLFPIIMKEIPCFSWTGPGELQLFLARHPSDASPSGKPAGSPCLTTIEVRSSLSKRLMAWSNDLYMAAEIRWVMSLFKSMDRPNSWMAEGGGAGEKELLTSYTDIWQL